MESLASTAKALQDYGPWAIVVVLGWLAWKLFSLLMEEKNGRLADSREQLKEQIRVNADTAHTLERFEEVLKAVPKAPV